MIRDSLLQQIFHVHCMPGPGLILGYTHRLSQPLTLITTGEQTTCFQGLLGVLFSQYIYI